MRPYSRTSRREAIAREWAWMNEDRAAEKAEADNVPRAPAWVLRIIGRAE
jgi:hypothetical protein